MGREGKTVKGAKGSGVGVCVEFSGVQSVGMMSSFYSSMGTRTSAILGRRLGSVGFVGNVDGVVAIIKPHPNRKTHGERTSSGVARKFAVEKD